MPRHIAAAWKHNAPGQIGRAPPEFAIDEVGDPHEKLAKRRRTADVVENPQERQLVAPSEIDDCDNEADEAAVKRHAPLPQLDDVGRVSKHFGLVEKHITEAAAENDAERRVEDEIVSMALGHWGAGLFE